MATRNFKREERRKYQIVEAAYEVIASKGYSNFTIEDIANTAGLSKGGVLHYFKTKEDILIHLLVQIYKILEDNIKKREKKYRTPERKIKGIIIAYLVTAKRNPSLYKVMLDFGARMTINERIRDINIKIYELIYSEIKKVIDIGIDESVFNNINSSNTAYAITSMITGVAFQWTFNNSVNIDHMARTCLDIIIEYLRKKN